MPEFDQLTERIAQMAYQWGDGGRFVPPCGTWPELADEDKQECRDFAARVLALPELACALTVVQAVNLVVSAAELVVSQRRS